MAFCPKCGKPLADDARFCTGCGAASAAPETNQQENDFSGADNTPKNDSYNPPVGNPYTPPVPGCNPAFAARLRSFLLISNPLLLALIVLIAGSALLNFFANVGVDIGNAATGLVLPALFIVGLDILRQQGAKTGDFPTTGFTLLQVVIIVEAVFMFVSAIGALIILVSSDKDLSILGKIVDVSALDSLINAVCVVLIAVFVLMGILYIFMANACASFKKYLFTGVMPKVSGFVVGCLWTFGVLAAIGSLSSLGDIGDAPLYGLASFLSGLCTAGSYIVGAMIASKAKQYFLY